MDGMSSSSDGGAAVAAGGGLAAEPGVQLPAVPEQPEVGNGNGTTAALQEGVGPFTAGGSWKQGGEPVADSRPSVERAPSE